MSGLGELWSWIRYGETHRVLTMVPVGRLHPVLQHPDYWWIRCSCGFVTQVSDEHVMDAAHHGSLRAMKNGRNWEKFVRTLLAGSVTRGVSDEK